MPDLSYNTVADLFKQSISFEVDGVRGYLSVYERGDPPRSFQVLLWERGGWYYKGTLQYYRGYFYLEKMEVQGLLDDLANLVMIWGG